MEPRKPRSTRYTRLSLGPRKPVLEEKRYEDDGWMDKCMDGGRDKGANKGSWKRTHER